jgi:hypothetical protein
MVKADIKNLFFIAIRELLKGDSEGLLKLQTDRVLVEDPKFCKYVLLYAEVIFS